MLGPQSVATSRDYEIALSGRDGASLAGVFDGTETFAAKAWTGDDQASAASLSPRWATVSDGSEFTGNPASLDNPVLILPVPTATIGTLAPGLYRVQIVVNPGTDDIEVLSDLIELTAAPGTATAPPVYGTFDQMRTLAPYIAEVVTNDPSLQSDLAEQRGLSRAWLERQLNARARRDLENDPTQDTDTLEADLVTIAGQLTANRLDTADGTAALACSHHALSLVLVSQIGKSDSPTSYQKQAGYHAERARAVLRGWVARLDDSDAGDGSSYRLLAP